MSFLINPYAFLAAGGDFESIATVTVGSGGASSIEFTSIPGTYQHLHIRMVGQATVNDASITFRFNGDSGSNYAHHQLVGTGSTAIAGAASSQTNGRVTYVQDGSTYPDYVAPCLIDVLDYASTTKAKTVRAFGGADFNTFGQVRVSSSLWTSTSAVTSLTFYIGTGGTPGISAGNFRQHFTAALYGIKAP